MIDEHDLAKFNSGLSPDRQYTLERLQFLYDHMPNQRIGVLFDLARWVKLELRK